MLDQAKLDQVVDEVARITGRNVTLDDVFAKVLAYNTSHPTTDRARIDSVLMKSVSDDARTWEASYDLSARVRPFILPPNPDLGFLARVCVPLISRGFRAGYLWILVRDEQDDPEPILEAVAGLGPRIEELAQTVMEASEASTQETVGREHALWLILQGAEAAEPDGWLSSAIAGQPVRIVIFSHPILRSDAAAGSPEQVRSVRHGMVEAQRSVHVPLIWAAAPDHVAAVVTGQVGELDLATVRQRLGQSLTRHRMFKGEGQEPEPADMGISEETTHLDSLPARYKEAVSAFQACIVDRRLAVTSEFRSIGIYQFLSQAGAALPRSMKLSAISEEPDGEELLSLLEKVYDYDGPRNDLAAELHIHRTTLYHRLRRIGKIVGEDPLTASVQLDLHLALKARRWAQRPQLGDLGEQRT